MARRRSYRLYARYANRDRQRPRRLTDRGRVVQTAMIVCASLGIDTDLNLVYQLFALLACLLLGSRLALRLHPPLISVRRELPTFATAGEPFDYRLHITNMGQRVERDLQLIDNPVIRLPTLEQFESRTEPGEATRNAYDRWIGYHRFNWLQKLLTGISTERLIAPEIGVHAQATIKCSATLLRRGQVQLASISVLHPDPLSLYYGQQHLSLPGNLLVLPHRYPVSASFSFPAGQQGQPVLNSASHAAGDSDEFMSLRDYRDGDALRRIHWASSARRGKPVIKEFQRESYSRQMLVMDSTVARAELLEEVIAVTTSLVLAASRQNLAMDLLFLANKPERIGSTELNRQLSALATVQVSSLAFEQLAEATLAQADQLSGCILVLGSWDAAQQRLHTELLSRQLPLRVFVLSADDKPLAQLPGHCLQLPLGQVAKKLATL